MPDEVILIAAITIDGYIARHKLETTNWSQDLCLFKQQTRGHTVIVGTNTFKTLSKNLIDREVIVVRRSDKPEKILSDLAVNKCFIIGGGKTYYRFSSFLTDLYITPHPYVFGKGISLFNGNHLNEIKLKFRRLLTVNKKSGIFQYQYKVLK